MKHKPVIAALILLAFGVSASAQSLADAARKEKERREALKTKTTAPVTNADLTKVKKKAAYTVVTPEAAAPNPGETENPETVSKPTAVEAAPAPGADAGLAEEARRKTETDAAELRGRWEREKERVEFLTLKMRSLQQQLFTFNNQLSKNQVQSDIAETNLKLQASTAEEARLKKELDKLPPSAGKPPIK